MAESKYGKYILREPRGRGEPPPRRTTQVMGVSMNPEIVSDIGAFDCNFNFLGIVAPHLLGDPPHKHEYDEFLFFIASDPKTAPDLGGEVEIALGEEWERHVITTSTIVCLPRGVYHCPIYMKKVDKPFYFGHIMLAPSYSSSAGTPV